VIKIRITRDPHDPRKEPLPISPIEHAQDGVPYCNEDCEQFDGKRCALLGYRPSDVCVPAVRELAKIADANSAYKQDLGVSYQ
jgi:hypothetical protein